MHNNFTNMPTDGTHILLTVVATHHIVKEIQQTLWHNVSLYNFGPHTSTTLPASIGSIWKIRHSLKKWPPECFPLHVLMTLYTDVWPILNVFLFASTYVCGGFKILCSESLCVKLLYVSQHVSQHMKLKYRNYSINVLSCLYISCRPVASYF